MVNGSARVRCVDRRTRYCRHHLWHGCWSGWPEPRPTNKAHRRPAASPAMHHAPKATSKRVLLRHVPRRVGRISEQNWRAPGERGREPIPPGADGYQVGAPGKMPHPVSATGSCVANDGRHSNGVAHLLGDDCHASPSTSGGVPTVALTSLGGIRGGNCMQRAWAVEFGRAACAVSSHSSGAAGPV